MSDADNYTFTCCVHTTEDGRRICSVNMIDGNMATVQTISADVSLLFRDGRTPATKTIVLCMMMAPSVHSVADLMMLMHAYEVMQARSNVG